MREILGFMYDYNNDEDMRVFDKVTEVLFLADPVGEDKTEFELSGLIAEELEVMGGKERRAIMMRAGLNPDEYDF